MKTTYLLYHKGHQIEFPSEASLRSYVDDFASRFDDVDISDLKMFRVEFYELNN